MKAILTLALLLLVLTPVLAQGTVYFTCSQVPKWHTVEYQAESIISGHYYWTTTEWKEPGGANRDGGKYKCDSYYGATAKFARMVEVEHRVPVNDHVERVHMTGGETITLYEHPNFSGRSITLRDDTPAGETKTITLPRWWWNRVTGYRIHQ